MSRSDEDLPSAWRSMWHTVKIGYRAEPGGLLTSGLLMLFRAMPDALMALWLKLMANGVIDKKPRTVMLAALGLAGSTALGWLLNVVLERVQRRFQDRVGIALQAHVAKLQASIATIEHQERPDYLDRLTVLREHVFTLDHLFLALFSTAGWIIRLVVTLVLLMSIHPLLGLLLLAAVPTVVSANWRPSIERAVEEKTAPDSRLARHLFVLGTTASPAKEVRIDGMAPSLFALRRQAWDRRYTAVASVRWGTALVNSGSWAVFGISYVAAIVYVASGLKAGAGSVVLVLAAGGRLSQYVGAVVGDLGFLKGIWIYSAQRLLWLEEYAAAVDSRADGAVPSELRQGIAFDHVSFRYPGTERLVLDDVSFTLPAGAVVAIVGENGAGKSTLVKLLCRLYAPDSGQITVDGIDLASFSAVAWRERLGGAFQDFFRFEFSAQDSVGVGELERLASRPAVETAVGRAGAVDVIEKLDAGLDTQLGPTWPEGVDVSFGQWQKLALARGFMRDEPLLLLLDEPTAALDAETEHALFERYAEASRTGANNGRMTILVSHRFSTVRMADLIVVMDGAHVVEVGSHDNLMSHGGTYAELYTIQATAFR